MAQAEQETESTGLALSLKQALVLAGTFLTVVGSVLVAYINSPPSGDAVTAAALGALQREYARIAARVDALEVADFVHEETHDDIELRLQRIQTDDTVCSSRVTKLEHQIDDHLRTASVKINQYEVNFERFRVLIEECLRRTNARESP